MDVTKLASDKALLSQALEAKPDAEMSNSIVFHQKLLAEDERISRMDLEYWIDYVYLFGVSDMIPLYDKMDPITFRNWDVYVLTAVILFLVVQLVYTVCCCRCFCLKKKTKVD